MAHSSVRGHACLCRRTPQTPASRDVTHPTPPRAGMKPSSRSSSACGRATSKGAPARSSEFFLFITPSSGSWFYCDLGRGVCRGCTVVGRLRFVLSAAGIPVLRVQAGKKSFEGPPSASRLACVVSACDTCVLSFLPLEEGLVPIEVLAPRSC